MRRSSWSPTISTEPLNSITELKLSSAENVRVCVRNIMPGCNFILGIQTGYCIYWYIDRLCVCEHSSEEVFIENASYILNRFELLISLKFWTIGYRFNERPIFSYNSLLCFMNNIKLQDFLWNWFLVCWKKMRR